MIENILEFRLGLTAGDVPMQEVFEIPIYRLSPQMAAVERDRLIEKYIYPPQYDHLKPERELWTQDQKDHFHRIGLHSWSINNVSRCWKYNDVWGSSR